MLEEIHFLLTYTCNYECDHRFLYCGPWSQGTFTPAQVEEVLDETVKIGTVKGIHFEGGEPLLFYPLLTHAVRAAHDRGFWEDSPITRAPGRFTELWSKEFLMPAAPEHEADRASEIEALKKQHKRYNLISSLIFGLAILTAIIILNREMVVLGYFIGLGLLAVSAVFGSIASSKKKKLKALSRRK